MKKVLMVYASQTGNTEVLTDVIATHLTDLGHQVMIKSFDFDVIDVTSLHAYDVVLVGTYTWDDGELPYEVEDFYIDLAEVDIRDITFGVYGSADSFYDTFGLAIDLVADQIKNQGGNLIAERLKIDILPSNRDEKRIKHFVTKIDEAMRSLAK